MSVAASKSSLPVAMPKGVSMSAGNASLIESFRDPEAVLSESVKNPEATAKKYAGLFLTAEAMEEAAKGTKTYAGAYVVRILDKAGKGETAKDLLGVGTSRVSQLRLSARLIFDFDFVPGSEDAALLTSRGQNDTEVKAAIDAAVKSDAGTEAGHKAIAKALDEYRNRQAVKKSEKPKAKPKPNLTTGAEKSEPLKGDAAKIAEIHRIIGTLSGSLGHDEIAALMGVRDEIASAMGATPEPVRVKGQKLYEAARKSRTAKSPASA